LADVAIQIKQMLICFGSIDYFSPTIWIQQVMLWQYI